MTIQTCIKDSFAVIGKEGSTKEGADFVARLWQDANGHFDEVVHCAKKDVSGKLVGIWGAMSDFSLSFLPWENNFSGGRYLAGVECELDAEAPVGWTKWIVPAYEFIYVENDHPACFSEMIDYLNENQIALAGAVQDFNCPETGKGYLFFPIRKL